MSKSTKKIDNIRVLVLPIIAKAFGVSEFYVRRCVDGKVDYGRSDEIKRAYWKKYNQIKAAQDKQVSIF